MWIPSSVARPSDWAVKLCKEQPNRYSCAHYGVRRKPPYISWKELFPYSDIRLLIALNRRNTLIWNNHIIVTPKELFDDIDYLSHAPFRKAVDMKERKFIVVDLNKLAWAAYDNGKLINWGPANGGSKRCKETGLLKCKTHTGVYFILRLDKVGKRSDLYPIDCKDKRKCGHEMPYFMLFHPDGSGLHGDRWLVGRNASHGCVRLIKEDAKWINKKFAYVGMPIIIMDY
jgi:hypothetical protein